MRPRVAALVAGWIALAAGTARAHEGPPYALFLDRALGGYEVSLWADPDVGTGTFYVMLEDAPDAGATEIHVAARPSSGRLPLERYAASGQPDGTYVAEVAFDRAERWWIDVSLAGPRGAAHAAVEVEVTPPGYGRWDLLVYLLPFLALGTVWGLGALRARRSVP